MEIPPITTLAAAQAAVNEIRSLGQKELTVRSLQEHYAVGAAGQRLFDFRQMREVTRSASHWSHVGWKDHIDPNQCDALLCPKDPPTRHPHGDPADHDADGRASRGQRDPLVGQKLTTFQSIRIDCVQQHKSVYDIILQQNNKITCMLCSTYSEARFQLSVIQNELTRFNYFVSRH